MKVYLQENEQPTSVAKHSSGQLDSPSLPEQGKKPLQHWYLISSLAALVPCKLHSKKPQDKVPLTLNHSTCQIVTVCSSPVQHPIQSSLPKRKGYASGAEQKKHHLFSTSTVQDQLKKLDASKQNQCASP